MKGSVRTVFTASALSPRGHYRQAIIHQGIIYVSDILPAEPSSGRTIEETLAEQTGRVPDNLRVTLEASGISPDRVPEVTIYLTDVREGEEMQPALFGGQRPAQTAIPVKGLHYGFRIELDAIVAQ